MEYLPVARPCQARGDGEQYDRQNAAVVQMRMGAPIVLTRQIGVRLQPFAQYNPNQVHSAHLRLGGNGFQRVFRCLIERHAGDVRSMNAVRRKMI